MTLAPDSLGPTKSVDELVSRSGHLHVLGTLLGNSVIWPMFERAAHVIKARGGTVSLDPNMRKELQADAETGARRWQHLPQATGAADKALHPENILIERVQDSLSTYHAACRPTRATSQIEDLTI